MMRNRFFDRTPIRSNRIRRISGSFAFLEHRFVRDGFWRSLDHPELLLYHLLVEVGDKNGMSFYSDERLIDMMSIGKDDFVLARKGLVLKDLIAYDAWGPRYQVLSLPPRPVVLSWPPPLPEPSRRHSPSPSRRQTSDPPPRLSQPGDGHSDGPIPIGQAIRDWLAAHADDEQDR